MLAWDGLDPEIVPSKPTKTVAAKVEAPSNKEAERRR
jgi:hypothetical protein